MTQIVLLLLILLGLGIFARSYNNWTRLMMVLIIVGVLVLLYLN